MAEYCATSKIQLDDEYVTRNLLASGFRNLASFASLWYSARETRSNSLCGISPQQLFLTLPRYTKERFGKEEFECEAGECQASVQCRFGRARLILKCASCSDATSSRLWARLPGYLAKKLLGPEEREDLCGIRQTVNSSSSTLFKERLGRRNNNAKPGEYVECSR